MKDKGILVLTSYSCLLGVVAGFAVGDGLHRYANAEHILFGEDRIQWEILLTSFAAILVAWRMYVAERNKTHSMAGATIITASGVVSAARAYATDPLRLKDNIVEILDTIEIAMPTVNQAILTCSDRRIVPALNDIQAAILNLRLRARGVDAIPRDNITMDRVKGLAKQKAELESRIDELRKLTR